MVDLSTSGRRLAEFQLEPPSPPESLMRRARQRRQRRRGAAMLAVVAVVAAVTVAAVTARGSNSQNVEVGGSGVTAIAGSRPRNWTPTLLGRLELWMPTNLWMECTYGTNDGPIGFGEMMPKLEKCPLGSTGRGAPLLITASTAAPPEWTTTTINGVSVREHTSGRTTTYDAPALGVSITAIGKLPNEIARTLRLSPIGQLSSTPALLHGSTPWPGYRSVTYDGVTFRVPDSWAVKTVSQAPGHSTAEANSCSFFPSPTAYLGDAGAKCNAATIDQDTPGIWIGPNLSELASATVTIRTHGDTVDDFRTELGAYNLLTVTIHASNGKTIHAVMSVTDASVARQILASFRD